MDFGHRFQVSRIHLFGHDTVFAHGLYLPEAGHCIRMGLQKFRLFSQTVRRHDIIGRKRTEILAASMFQQFIQRRDNALVFTMNKAELEFFGKLFQDFGRAILATIVKSYQFKSDTLLRKNRTNCRFNIFLVIVTRQEHRNNRRKLTLFGFFPLRESLHVNVFGHLLCKHVRYGVFHLSLLTKM